MLQIPDKRTAKLLKLADYIDDCKDFDMRLWSRCIAGQCCRMVGDNDLNHWRSFHDKARDYLELDNEEANDLFSPTELVSFMGLMRKVRRITKADAVRALRHLAMTGEIEFGRARERTKLRDALAA